MRSLWPIYPHNSQKRNGLSRLICIYPLWESYITSTIRATGNTDDKERTQVQAEVTREWVTYKQAEEISGLSRTTLRKLVDGGQIRIKRVGRAVRINRASLDAYMNDDDFGHE